MQKLLMFGIFKTYAYVLVNILFLINDRYNVYIYYLFASNILFFYYLRNACTRLIIISLFTSAYINN